MDPPQIAHGDEPGGSDVIAYGLRQQEREL